MYSIKLNIYGQAYLGITEIIKKGNKLVQTMD